MERVLSQAQTWTFGIFMYLVIEPKLERRASFTTLTRSSMPGRQQSDQAQMADKRVVRSQAKISNGESDKAKAGGNSRFHKQVEVEYKHGQNHKSGIGTGNEEHKS